MTGTLVATPDPEPERREALATIRELLERARSLTQRDGSKINLAPDAGLRPEGGHGE